MLFYSKQDICYTHTTLNCLNKNNFLPKAIVFLHKFEQESLFIIDKPSDISF